LRSVLQVKQSDWEAFLKEFSEFAKKYELLLGGLDLAEAKRKAEDERVKEQVKTATKTIGQVQSAIEKLCKETEDALHATGSRET
jgi:hypothetical protein